MGRRAKGEGSIIRRSDGRWQARYEVNGKRKYLYGKIRSEVSVKLREALSEVTHGLIYDDKNLTLKQHLHAWLNNSKKSVRIGTFERYEQIVCKHLMPELGGIKLKNLSPMMVQDLYQTKLEALSPRTVRYIHVTLHKSLEQAVKWNLISKNVTDLVDPPKIIKEEIRPLNVEEVRILFDTVSGHPLEAIYILAVTAGLRRGEILGLYWQDVDLNTGSLQVKRSLSFTKEGPIFVPPKTAKGKRSISLSKICVEALRKLKTSQEKTKENWTADYSLVFPNDLGEPRRSRNVLNTSFKRIKKKGNLPDIRFHDLRHTCATLLLTKGVHPKIVQELLGHSSISITLDTYSHCVPNMQEKVVEAMEDIFEGEEH